VLLATPEMLFIREYDTLFPCTSAGPKRLDEPRNLTKGKATGFNTLKFASGKEAKIETVAPVTTVGPDVNSLKTAKRKPPQSESCSDVFNHDLMDANGISIVTELELEANKN
jgi:hypothetical protein